MSIQLNFWPRQSGKTDYILDNIKDKDLVICMNESHSYFMKRKYDKMCLNKKLSFMQKIKFLFKKNKKNDVLFLSVNNSTLFQSIMSVDHFYNNIWIDEFDHMTIEEQNNIILYLQSSKKPLKNYNVIGYSTASENIQKRIDLKTFVYLQVTKNQNLQYLGKEKFITEIMGLDYKKRINKSVKISDLFFLADEINIKNKWPK
jgi:hypothetical protein